MKETCFYVNDTLRLRKIDPLNMVLEKLGTTYNPRTQVTKETWQFKGYFADYRSAFIAILKQELFDSVDEHFKLEDIVEQMRFIEEEVKELGRRIDKKGQN